MGTFRIAVRAKPGSSRERVGGRYGDGDQLVVAVSAQAVDGKANEAVLRAVAKALAVPRRSLEVVGGHTARSKVIAIDIDDTDEARVQATVQRLLTDEPISGR